MKFARPIRLPVIAIMRHRPLVWAVMTILSALPLRAATVTWTGGAGDNLWSSPLNWSGGALPGAGDDVVINVPGNITVRYRDLPTSIRSLQCQESLVMENGYFVLTGGASTVGGEFSVGNTAIFIVNGADTVFTATGVVTNLAGNLQATGGGSILLPTLRRL